jgi:hypothetical protein
MMLYNQHSSLLDLALNPTTFKIVSREVGTGAGTTN